MKEFRVTTFRKSTFALTLRWFRRIKREPISIAVEIIQPAIWLILFGNLFDRIVSISNYSYISFMTAGVIVMTTFNGALGGGVELLFDRETKLLYRLLATPVRPSAIIASRLLFVLVLVSFQSLMILLIAVALGVAVSSGILGVILILLIGIFLGIGILSLSMALAYGLKNHGQFFSIIGFVSLPIIFASSAFAPLNQMPLWLKNIAMFNPLTYAIEGVRSLILIGLNFVTLFLIMLVLIIFDFIMFSIAVFVMRKALEF